MDELKKCPFCGGEAFSREYDEQRPDEPYGLVAYHDPACFLAPHADHSGFEARWNTRSPVTDEMVEVRIGILGCDDSTYLTRQMTKEQFTFLEEVAEQISEQSTYGCMPVMNAALTAALGGPHG